jgi:hypothetical protein
LPPRRRPVAHRLFDVGRIVDQFEFEQRGFAYDFLRPLRILNSWKLHENVLLSFALNNRLAHAELVDTIADGFEGLIHGVITQ